MSDLWIAPVVRNDRLGLQSTRESIEKQTQRPRLLIVDGASTDGTTPDARAWARKLGADFASEPDAGPYGAMNKALQRHPAHSRVWFLNAGDVLLAIDSAEVTERLTGGAQFVWGFGPHSVIEADDSGQGIVRGRLYTVHSHAYGKTPICHQAVIARVGPLQDLRGFDLDLPIAADYKMLM